MSKSSWACVVALALLAVAPPAASKPEPAEAEAKVETKSCATSHARMPMVSTKGGHVLWPLHLITILPGNFFPNDADTREWAKKMTSDLAHSWWLQQTMLEYVDKPRPATSESIEGVELGPPGCLSADEVNAYVERQIAVLKDKNGKPRIPHAANNLYLVMMPKDVRAQGACDGSDPHPGFHHPFSDPGLGDGWAVIQPSLDHGKFDREGASVVVSHEVAEAITNTHDGYAARADKTLATPKLIATDSPWIAIGDEIGDLCEGARIFEKKDGKEYLYQRMFSNKAAAAGGDPCVPRATGVYFNTSPERSTTPGLAFRSWVRATDGKKAVIKLFGWVDGGTEACGTTWNIEAEAKAGKEVNNVKLLPVVPSAKSTMSNKSVATVTVTVPKGAGHGWWGIVRVTSTPVNKVPGEDAFRTWYYGVYTD